METRFTWWPWRLLALAVPVIATAAAYLQVLERGSPGPDTDVSPLILGVLGAGNAFIIAAASGNFARLTIALPVGVAAGFLATTVLRFQPALLVYLGFLFVWIGLALLEWLVRLQMSNSPLLGCAWVLPYGLTGVVCVGFTTLMIDRHRIVESCASVPLAYPFV